jgi:hypothetical protein
VAHAAVAEKMSGSAFSQFSQPAGKGMGFYTGEDGYMYCDNLRVDDIRHQVRGCRCMHSIGSIHHHCQQQQLAAVLALMFLADASS